MPGLHPEQPHAPIIANTTPTADILSRRHRRRAAGPGFGLAGGPDCQAGRAPDADHRARPRARRRWARRSDARRDRRPALCAPIRAPRPAVAGSALRIASPRVGRAWQRAGEERGHLAQAAAGRRRAARSPRARSCRSPRATISPARPARSAACAAASADSHGRRSPPRPSSAKTPIRASRPASTCCSAASTQQAIARSNSGPPPRVDAGARFTVTRLRGNPKPLLSTAACTRSRASRAAPLPSPITAKAGRPPRGVELDVHVLGDRRAGSRSCGRGRASEHHSRRRGRNSAIGARGRTLHVPVSLSSHFFAIRPPRGG